MLVRTTPLQRRFVIMVLIACAILATTALLLFANMHHMLPTLQQAIMSHRPVQQAMGGNVISRRP